MMHRALPLLLLTALTSAPCAAQRRAPALDAPVARLAVAPAEAAAPSLGGGTAARGRRASAGRAALSVLGGAVLGAGAGYLTSQVAWSDWDKSSNSEFKARRMSFTLGGSAVGALTGLLLGRSDAGVVPAQPGVVPGRPAGRANLITEEEVRASTAANLYELVQALRPMWLRRNGANGHTVLNPDIPADQQVVSAADDSGVRVYRERGLVGDIFSLRQIAVAEVTSIEFLDAATATYRLGQGNPSGAIVVHTGLRQR